jgi:bisphosphoglycerate-dependent phosphoglycerate mutase
LPRRIILVRHAESLGNRDPTAYTALPDPKVPLTELGKKQAREAGRKIRAIMEADGKPFRLFFIHSPYLVRATHKTETNTPMHFALFGMQNRAFGTYLITDDRILISEEHYQ